MRAKEFIIEYRDRMFQYIKSVLPAWPDYVLKDWVYNLARGDHQAGVYFKPDDSFDKWGFNKETILKMIKDQGLSPDTKWQLVPDMKFTMDMFDSTTQKKLIGRAGGKSDLGMGIHKDKERHDTQAALAKKQGGVRKEPVILIKHSDGYELLEGWHRTIQHFDMYPDGYTGPAYVAVANDVTEEKIDEMPLPADWDSTQYAPNTTFKQRLNYALERAKKLGTGSSRVAMIIEYQGRPTVLKVAKNRKGLAQNSVEADVLSDGYASQLGILIPIIDYDEQNREPVWVHTEMAQKATEKQLCNLMKCDNLQQLVNMAYMIAGKKKYLGTYQTMVEKLRQDGKSEDDIETMTDYANKLVDLNNSFDVELGDFTRRVNWGIYQGQPVIIDVGFNSNVMSQYYKESKEGAR